jgi:hypothetical protein
MTPRVNPRGLRVDRAVVTLATLLVAGAAACAVTVSSGGSDAADAGATADATPDSVATPPVLDARDDRRRVDIGDGPSNDGPVCRLNDPFIPGPCDQCLEANCCAEMNLCFGSPDCMALTDCAFACVGADAGADGGADAGSCAAQCEAMYPNQVAAFRGWVACFGYSCMSQCQ